MTAPSLNDVLTSLGYTTRPAAHQGAKDILDSAGQVLFTGRAWEVWEWLGPCHYCGMPDSPCDNGDPCTTEAPDET